MKDQVLLKGYLIFAADGSMLNKYRAWEYQSRLRDGFVWSEDRVKEIIAAAEQWDKRPIFGIPATYSEKAGVQVLNGETLWAFPYWPCEGATDERER